jgi:hypothetical protein
MRASDILRYMCVSKGNKHKHTFQIIKAAEKMKENVNFMYDLKKTNKKPRRSVQVILHTVCILVKFNSHLLH